MNALLAYLLCGAVWCMVNWLSPLGWEVYVEMTQAKRAWSFFITCAVWPIAIAFFISPRLRDWAHERIRRDLDR